MYTWIQRKHFYSPVFEHCTDDIVSAMWCCSKQWQYLFRERGRERERIWRAHFISFMYRISIHSLFIIVSSTSFPWRSRQWSEFYVVRSRSRFFFCCRTWKIRLDFSFSCSYIFFAWISINVSVRRTHQFQWTYFVCSSNKRQFTTLTMAC